MIPRLSLSTKILFTAFVNLLLLILVFLIFARLQFRFDLSSFVLAPSRERIASVSHLAALQLENTPPQNWSKLLAQYSSSYPAEFYLFNNTGVQLAGQPIKLPDEVAKGVIRNDFFSGPPHRRRHPPSEPEHPHGPPPPWAFSRTTNPVQYWVGVPIPIWGGTRPEPENATLVWRFSSLWTNSFFFDYKPWIAVLMAVILVCIVCWLPLIRDMTRAISQLTLATGQIAEGHFEIELATNRRDELGQLSASISAMAHRLSGFVHGQRRFLGDIAHELCSPIARIQVALGILEHRANEDQIEYVADLREEVEHMSGLVDELLSFSKAQITTSTDLKPVNVAEILQRVIQREASDATQVEVRVDKRLEVMAHPEYLFRSLANVVRNAIRYAAQGGPILVSAANGDGAVSIMVSDNGPGVPESELEEIFKPFYRPEFARQRQTGGVGLGLAIVKSCVQACGGTVVGRNRSPNGLEVEIRLPAANN